MKAIVMKLEITQLRCEDIVTYNISYKVSRKLARFDEPHEYTVHGLLWDYCIFILGECIVLIAMCSLVLQEYNEKIYYSGNYFNGLFLLYIYAIHPTDHI